MLSDARIIQPDGPCAVKVLTDLYAALSVGFSVGSRRDIDRQASQTDGVVVGDGGFISEADPQTAIGSLDFSEDGTGLCRGFGEACVVARQKGRFQPDVGRVDVGDAVEIHFGDQPVLEGASFPFDASFGLSREGGQDMDAQLLEDPSDMCDSLAIMSPLTAKLKCPLGGGDERDHQNERS